MACASGEDGHGCCLARAVPRPLPAARGPPGTVCLLSPTLQSTKARLKVTQKELKDLQWEHEVVEQRFSKVRAVGGEGIRGAASTALSSPAGILEYTSRA